MKVCIVSSCGGHLTEVRSLKPAYEVYEHFYDLNGRAILPRDMDGRTYFITHSERDPKFFVNLWEAYRILRRERPDVILSTGGGPGGAVCHRCASVLPHKDHIHRDDHKDPFSLAHRADHVPSRRPLLLSVGKSGPFLPER